MISKIGCSSTRSRPSTQYKSQLHKSFRSTFVDRCLRRDPVDLGYLSGRRDPVIDDVKTKHPVPRDVITLRYSRSWRNITSTGEAIILQGNWAQYETTMTWMSHMSHKGLSGEPGYFLIYFLSFLDHIWNKNVSGSSSLAPQVGVPPFMTIDGLV